MGETEKDVITSVVSFLHKLLGHNLWILPVAIAIASWYLYFYVLNHWGILYAALICSLITILLIVYNLYAALKNAIKRRKRRKAEELAQINKIEREKALAEREKNEYIDFIWKYIAHIDADLVSKTTSFLDLDIHDGNQRIRFIKLPDNCSYSEQKKIDDYKDLCRKFTFVNPSETTLELIEYEYLNNVIYFYIEPYFHALLENFRKTNRWEKILNY